MTPSLLTQYRQEAGVPLDVDAALDLFVDPRLTSSQIR